MSDNYYLIIPEDITLWTDCYIERLNDRYDNVPTLVELTRPYVIVENMVENIYEVKKN